MSDYLMQAENFCKTTGTKVTFEFLGKELASWDNQKRLHNAYTVTVARNNKEFSFKYYDSIHNTEKGIEPDVYDALCCLSSNMWEVGDFYDFVRTFCYDENKIDSNYDYEMELRNTHKEYQRIYKKVMEMFGDVLNELSEIA